MPLFLIEIHIKKEFNDLNIINIDPSYKWVINQVCSKSGIIKINTI